MQNKKIMIMVGAGMALSAVMAAGYIFFPESGKNILENGAALAVASWNSMFEGNGGEIIPDQADVRDDFSASGTIMSGDAADSTSEAVLPPSDGTKSIVSMKKKTIAPKKSAVLANAPPPPAPSPTDILASDGGNNLAEGNLGNESGSAMESGAGNGAGNENGIAPTSSLENIPLCTFSNSPAASLLSQKIILNEVAWMGSSARAGESSSDAGKREWIEIKNNSGADISLAGWQVADASGKLKITFSSGDHLAAGAFAVLERGNGSSSPAEIFSVVKFYSGSLVNGGDTVAVITPGCSASDILDASGGWPGGDNVTKQTLERNADGTGWHTSVNPGGTPGAENSSLPIARYNVTVAFQGDGIGSVTSSPAGLTCGNTSCSASYASGTILSINMVPGKDSTFEGWSGACYGQQLCSFTVSGPATIIATLRSTVAVIPAPAAPPSSPVPTPSPSPSPEPGPSPSSTLAAGTPTHLEIAEIQIAGASTTNDFVKIYNPAAGAVDIGGWRFRKKSGTGTDASIKVFPDGATIAPAGYFVWANSAGGFSEAVGADVSSTETLSADNSVALVDANGATIDAIAWGTGANQYGEGTPYPTNPIVGQILKRIFADGAMVDTGNNAADFIIQ